MRRSAQAVTAAVCGLLEKAGPFPAGRCLIGFSGGADSTLLIRLCAVLRDSGEAAPEAVHVNHGLRGEESDKDELFCRAVCEELDIPFHAVHAELSGKRDEDSCRRERFRCFRAVMEETGIRDLVLGHNQDDLAETFLMRLMRGAGLEGLACMSGTDEHEGIRIWRPLLRIGRAEIRSALKSDAFGWREDSSNGSEAYLRNRIRSRLLPAINGMAEGASGRIARTAEILYLDNQAIRERAEWFLDQHSSSGWLDAGELLKSPEAEQRRVLRTWWKRSSPETKEHSLSAGQTESLLMLLKAERGKVNLPGNLNAERGRHGIYLTGMRKNPVPEVSLEDAASGEIRFGDFSLVISDSLGDPGDGIMTQEVPEGFLAGCVLRTRKPGDRIRPFGMKGSRKLQDYLTDRWIDAPMRDEIPMICRGNEVLWAAGIGAGAVPAWDAGKHPVRLTWRGEMPWKLKKGEKRE